MKVISTLIFYFLLPVAGFTQNLSKASSEEREIIAQNMLLYQRSNGGWPKHLQEVNVDYLKRLSESELAILKENYASGIDATIDNNATTKEIRFLASQFKKTNKTAYLEAVKKGLTYLLNAQYQNGGWPQYYPDKRVYRHLITYNDNAMINVLNLLQDVKEGKKDLDIGDKLLEQKVTESIDKGIDCILKTQIKVNGKLTAWCAQHNEKTFQPANARAFELISLSGSESVGILQFLMRQKKPSDKINIAVVAGVAWLKAVELKGYKYEDIMDTTKPKGYDRFLQKDPKSVVWARFYEIDTNEPFVCGRDGVKKKDLKDIEYERRAGYAWYGTWPKDLLEISYPAWAAINLTNSVLVK